MRAMRGTRFPLCLLTIVLTGASCFPAKPDGVEFRTQDCERVESELAWIYRGIILYEERAGSAPESLPDLVRTGVLESLPSDPWGNPYQYTKPSSATAARVRVYTLGADGMVGGAGINADFGTESLSLD